MERGKSPDAMNEFMINEFMQRDYYNAGVVRDHLKQRLTIPAEEILPLSRKP
jgi:hypothetical protein